MAQMAGSLSSSINEMKHFDKYDMSRWESARFNTIATLNECAKCLDKVSSDTSVAKGIGGGVGIVGGAVCVIGLLTLNPVAFGWGAVISASGSITSLASSLIKAGWTKSKQKEAGEAIKLDQELYNKYEKIDKNLRSQIKKTISMSVKVVSSAKTSVNAVNTVRALKNSVEWVNLLKNGTIPAELAGDISKQLIFSPSFKLAGLVGADAAVAVGKVFAIGGTALSLGSGLWDMISGIKEFTNGSDVSKDMRKTATELRKNLEDIRKMHQTTMNAINGIY